MPHCGQATGSRHCASGRNAARLVASRLHVTLMRNILSVGALATLNPLLTNGLVALTAALVGAYAGTAAVAGYGIAVRLEYLMMPLAFGLGAPMVAMVGANIGAGQPERALRVALTGGAMAFVLGELIGLTAALFPEAWLRLFGAEAAMLQAGAAYLRIVGPLYGFFALGFSMYFASQGAGRMFWPLAGSMGRLLILALGGWLCVHVFQAPASALFAVIAFSLVLAAFSSVNSFQLAEMGTSFGIPEVEPDV